MIFNEVYGCYYNAVSKIIENAIDGELTDRKLNDLSKQYAFEESNLTIVPSIKNQQWQLIDENMKTPILNKPRMPLTMIEKRWLKTISNDSKFKLFNENTEKIDNIESLYIRMTLFILTDIQMVMISRIPFILKNLEILFMQLKIN